MLSNVLSPHCQNVVVMDFALKIQWNSFSLSSIERGSYRGRYSDSLERD